jgi:hypothetical protein
MEKLVLKEKTTIISGEKARRLAGLLEEESADIFEIIGFLETPEIISSAIAEDIILVQDAPNPFDEYLGIFEKYLNIKW